MKKLEKNERWAAINPETLEIKELFDAPFITTARRCLIEDWALKGCKIARIKLLITEIKP